MPIYLIIDIEIGSSFNSIILRVEENATISTNSEDLAIYLFYRFRAGYAISIADVF